MIRSIFPVLTILGLSSAVHSAAPVAQGSRAMAGLWEVSARADGHGAQRVCLSTLSTLLQWEHRALSCGQKILGSSPRGVTVDYNCGPAGFGHSRLTVITPRTLKVETQGISADYPFQYTLHARRVGGCAVR